MDGEVRQGVLRIYNEKDMSKRAEESSLEAFPITGKWIGNQYGEWDPDINRTLRAAHQQGYEQAEKDMIERAIAWLKLNAVNYIYTCTDSYPDAPFIRVAISGKCWEDLKEHLENE